MRIVLGLVLLIGVSAGCAKKPAPQTPANKQEMKNDTDAKDSSKPDDKTDAADPKTSDDPCGG
ncbi:hypothetical protein BH11MYX1_BH11MYX1_13020 [soil metagenome]